MTWQDRVREAAFTSPSGTRITFEYENVGRTTPLRSTTFEFPNVDGGYVQQNGHGPRRYPMRCYFTGSDHDLEATAFEAALLETGLGRLEHPFYGTFTVVPVGEITRRDDLKEAANQSIIEVAFFRTLTTVYPSSSRDPENEILAALEGFDLAAAQNFLDSTDLDSVVRKAGIKATIRKFLKSVSSILDGVSAATTSVNREFRDLQSVVNYGLDVFVGQPLLLAQQILNLLSAPARALAGIRSRLDAYGDLADDIFGSVAGDPTTAFASGTALLTRVEQISNDFHTADLFAMGTVEGSVRAVLATTFETKPEAIEAAVAVSEQFDAFVAWRDTGFAAMTLPGGVGPEQVDTGEAYQLLNQAVATCVGFLIEISFTLVPERRVVLDRARTPLDLAAELYGDVDERLDFLINSNGLTGSEILELPAGKTVRYYV